MALRHGNSGTVTWESNSQANVTAWKLNCTRATADATEMGDTWEVHLGGHTDWTATVEINVDTTGVLAGTGAALSELGTSATLTLSDGTKTYSGTALFKSYSVNQVATDVVKATLNFEGSGAVS